MYRELKREGGLTSPCRLQFNRTDKSQRDSVTKQRYRLKRIDVTAIVRGHLNTTSIQWFRRFKIWPSTQPLDTFCGPCSCTLQQDHLIKSTRIKARHPLPVDRKFGSKRRDRLRQDREEQRKNSLATTALLESEKEKAETSVFAYAERNV